MADMSAARPDAVNGAGYHGAEGVSAVETPRARNIGLSEPRAALARAIRDLDAANAALADARRPLRELEALAAAAAAKSALAASLLAEHEQAVGSWLLAPEGARPARTIESSAAECGAANLAGDLKAAERASGLRRDAYRFAADGVARARDRRDEAMTAAAVDAARTTIEAELKPAIAKVLKIEARLRGVMTALIELGNRQQAPVRSGPGVAGVIADLIKSAKADVAVARDDDGGRHFLDRLAGDPEVLL
jgi:hypothetical protein